MARKKAKGPQSVQDESSFVQRVYFAISAADPKSRDWDSVPIIQRWMCPEPSRPIEELEQDEAWPSYTEVVLALYKLATREYVSWQMMEQIIHTLGRCSNHQFGPFVKLTNPRHNPNEPSRRWATHRLYAVLKGHTGGGMRNWQRGAMKRLKELEFPLPQVLDRLFIEKTPDNE
ncbi:MAG: hypothetical protein WCW16_05450 [Candidatus Magasanikbacteria bacterium]